MMVFVVDSSGLLANKRERDTPVPADVDRPGALAGTVKLMQMQPGQVHVVWVGRRIQPAENQAQSRRVFRLDPRLAAGSERTFETLVLESLNRHRC